MSGIRNHTHHKNKRLVAVTQGSISRDCSPMVICRQDPKLFSRRSKKLTFTMEMNLEG